MDLTFVILNTAATPVTNGHLPETKDINDAIRQADSQGKNLRVIIPDLNLSYALRLVRGEGLVFQDQCYKSDASKIKSYDNGRVSVSDDNLQDIDFKNITGRVVYISYTGHQSSYEVLSLVNDFSPNRAVACFKQQDDTQSLVPYVTLDTVVFPLYTGARIPENLTPADLKSVYDQILTGCLIAKEYIRVGFGTQADREPPDANKELERFAKASAMGLPVADTPMIIVKGWTMNPETLILKGLIYTYGLFSTQVNTTSIQQIAKNAGFRFQLFDLLKRVIANFSVNNRMVQEDQVGAEVWNSTPVYDFLIPQLRESLQKL